MGRQVPISYQEKVNAIGLLGTDVYAVVHESVPVLEKCGLCGGSGELIGADNASRACPSCCFGAVTIGKSSMFYVYGPTRLRRVTISEDSYNILYNVSDDLGGHFGCDSNYVFLSLDDAVKKAHSLMGTKSVLYVRHKFRPNAKNYPRNIDDPTCRNIIHADDSE